MGSLSTLAEIGIDSRIRRSQGRLARNAIASAKVTRDEQQELEAAARRENKALSEWAREVLIREARTKHTDAAVFTELVALRLLLSNILRTVALGETMTPEAYAQVLAEVRNGKHEAARDMLAQYRNTSTGE